MNELLRRLLFLPPQASTMARQIDHLHYAVIGTTMAGATLIALIAVWFLVRYRRPGPEPTREQTATQPPILLEAGAVVLLLSLFLGWWWVGFRQFVRLRVAPDDALDVYVSAKQWMWKFADVEGHHELGVLTVPAGRPIKLIMTSRDVIHSFYVPDFRVKEDVLPGRYTTAWFQADRPGRHQVLCAEYCGTGHSTMRAEVLVLDGEDYARWLERATTAAPPSAPRRGVEVAAEHGCLRCHTLDGMPHLGPTWASLYRATIPLERGGSIVADEPYLTESMMDPEARLHAGYRAIMPSYRGQLAPADVAALLQLIRSLAHVPVRAATPSPTELSP